MAKLKKSEADDNDILAYLPPIRRQELLNEATRSKAQSLLDRHRSATLGKFVTALTADSHWEALREISLQSILFGSLSEPGQRGRRSLVDAATLERIAGFIEKTPGLRSEEIQRELALPSKLVKIGLAKLRDTKRVRTAGQRRATTYSPN